MSIVRGMLPTGTPKPTHGRPFAQRHEPAAKIYSPVKVQASKASLISLEGPALRSQLAASCQRPKWPALIYLGAP